jgi:hypothetical protein
VPSFQTFFGTASEGVIENCVKILRGTKPWFTFGLCNVETKGNHRFQLLRIQTLLQLSSRQIEHALVLQVRVARWPPSQPLFSNVAVFKS